MNIVENTQGRIHITHLQLLNISLPWGHATNIQGSYAILMNDMVAGAMLLSHAL